jgi:hypothetical protein
MHRRKKLKISKTQEIKRKKDLEVSDTKDEWRFNV